MKCLVTSIRANTVGNLSLQMILCVPSVGELTRLGRSGARNVETPLKLVKCGVVVAVWFCRLIVLLVGRLRFSVTTVNTVTNG